MCEGEGLEGVVGYFVASEVRPDYSDPSFLPAPSGDRERSLERFRTWAPPSPVSLRPS